jgi:hypothetical protein
MSTDSIKEMLRQINDVGQEIYSIPCTVKSVSINEKVCNCEPIDGGADIPEVKLMADNVTGFVIIPKVGSAVIVTMTSDSTGYVGMFSEIEEIQLNGDNYDGLPQIKKLVEKYNALEQSINDLKQILITWTPVSGDGGAALKALLSTWSQLLVKTIQAEIENKTVKHGGG